jgi:hypothetical protein
MTRYVAHADTAAAAVEGGAVVLHMGTKCYYSLNETGAVLWRLLESGTTEDDAAAQLVQLYEVEAREARDAVSCLIADLLGERLVAAAVP